MDPPLVVVLYHDISSDRDPLTTQLEISTAPELFAQHLLYFAKHFDFVSAADILTGKLPRRAILVTFDDAYRSVLQTAGPILKAVNAPSLFFVNPGTVQSEKLPIDNVLSYAVEQLGLERVLALIDANTGGILSTREIIANVVPTKRQSEVRGIKERLLSALNLTETQMYRACELFMRPADINALANYRVDVGNHSMSHTHFRTLNDEELETEIAVSRTNLEQLSGQRVRCLSIPYGNKADATEPALRTARASGHEAIFLVHAKSNRFRPAGDIYYRTSLQSTPAAALPLRLHALPALRSIRDMLRPR